jgi:hypothetical protein
MIQLVSCSIKPGPKLGTAVIVDENGRELITIDEVSDDHTVNLFLHAQGWIPLTVIGGSGRQWILERSTERSEAPAPTVIEIVVPR